MIQAMVCGRPVVVTEVGGTGEWVTEPTTGFIAEAASMPSISRALERAWQAQAEWQSIGEAARRTALAKLDNAPQKTLFGLLKSCLEGRAGPGHALHTHGVGTDE
jgi:glycogen synthase